MSQAEEQIVMQDGAYGTVEARVGSPIATIEERRTPPEFIGPPRAAVAALTIT